MYVRAAVLALLLGIAAGEMPAAAGADGDAGCAVDADSVVYGRGQGQLVCRAVGRSGSRGRPAAPGPAAVAPAPPPPEHLAARPVVVQMAPGREGRCIDWVEVDLGRPVSPSEHLAWEFQYYRWSRFLPLCPAERGAPGPAGSAASAAEEVVRRVALPVPAPRIDPGRMLVGLRAHLEAGAPLESRHAEATPLGPIEVHARARVHVDWGDGARSGPHGSAGGPHPDGAITHVYQRAGAYDVVVRYVWVAHWSLGGASGTIDTGLETVGAIRGFPVEQRQAVIIAPR